MNRVLKIVSGEELIRRAEVYQDFCEKMMTAFGTALFEEESLMRSRMTEVSFMFLGKKPAMLWEEAEVGMAEEMVNFGFRQSGLITYNEEAVLDVLGFHPDVFRELPPTPQALIEHVSSSSDEVCTVALGLLMGFPKASVFDYIRRGQNVAASQAAMVRVLEKLEKDGLEESEIIVDDGMGQAQVNRWMRYIERNASDLGYTADDIPSIRASFEQLYSSEGVDVHGMTWIDPYPNAESTALQQELDAVYREAGIDQILESCKNKASLIDAVANNHKNFSHILKDAE